MEISVVIPTINTRPVFLTEAVQSVLNQTLLPKEIVVVNNGRGVITLPRTDVPIRVVRAMYKSGGHQARNIGAVISKGDYISFLDDDDLWADDYLATVDTAIRKHSSDCLIARLDKLENGSITRWKNPQYSLKKEVLLVRNPSVTGSTITIKRSAFMEVSGFNTSLRTGEDKALVLEVLRHGFSVMALPDAQAIARKHDEGNLSDDMNMLAGISQFYDMYKNEMTPVQRISNIQKIAYYKRQSKSSSVSTFTYFFWRMVFKVSQILHFR